MQDFRLTSPALVSVLQSLRGDEVAWAFPGLLSQQCWLHTGYTVASPERVARRRSQWAGSARRGVLPSCEYRPFRTERAKGSGESELREMGADFCR